MTRPAIHSKQLMLAVLLAVAPLHSQTQTVMVPAVLPDTTLGASYNVSLSVANPQCDVYNWILQSGGTPPPGLGLNTVTAATSAISGVAGMPTQDAYTFTVVAGGSNCETSDVSQTYTIRVLAIQDSSFPVPTGVVGISYTHTLSAWGLSPVGAGGSGWSATGLPPGLSISNTGQIAGTPTTAGTFNGTVTVFSSGGTRTATRAISIVIANPLTFTTPASLPPGTIGVPYSVTIQTSGGLPPVNVGVEVAPNAPGLTYNQSTRTLAGTPTATGTFGMNLFATDAGQQVANRIFTVVVRQPNGVILTDSLPTGGVGVAYSAPVTSSGFVTPPTWSATGLPPGLAINSSSGIISGTPTTNGIFSATISASASDQSAPPKTLSISIVNVSPLIFTTPASLPPATIGAPYSVTIQTSGGLSPVNIGVEVAPNAPGLAYNQSTRILSGTPTATGTYGMGLFATDALQQVVNRNFTVVVRQPNGVILTESLPTGSIGVAYSATLTSSGFVTPPTWSATGLPPGLTINPSSGVISGSPTTNGTYGVTISASASDQSASPKTLLIAIGPPPLDFTPAVLPGGVVGVSYSAAFTATGGEGNYVFALAGSSLPPGLVMSASGAVTGTPTQAGDFRFVVRVTSGEQVTEKAISMTVDAAALSLSPSTLPAGVMGVPYSQTLVASGGTPPYVFRFGQSSNVPPGLSLSSGGVLSGTPTAAGSFGVSIAVSDARERRLQRDYTLVVSTEMTIQTTALPDGMEGESYRAQIETAGGSAPFTYDLAAGALPAGLTLSAAGEITGTPTLAGRATFTVRSTDANKRTATRELSILVFAVLAITPDSLPGATLLKDYSAQLTASGGQSPYVWQIVNGALPDGIQFSGGAFRGAATRAGTFSFDVRVTDQRQRSITKRYSIVVAGGPSIEISGGVPGATVGVSYLVRFTATGGRAPYRWSFTGQLPPGLSLNASDGSISGIPTTVGAFDFTLRVEDADGLAATGPYRITVVAGPVPPVTITGISGVAAPSSQLTFGITIGAPYPAALDGVVTLTFKPDSGADDPAVVLSNGSRTMPFQVPAGSTTANFPVGRAAVQTGTVAGLVTMQSSLSLNGADVTPTPPPVSTLRIDAAAPVITRMDTVRTPTGFELTIFGFATSRQVTQAQVTLTPAAGFTLAGTSFSVDLGSLFTSYYASSASAPFGSQFRLVLPFTLSDPLGVASVSVTLVNAQGSSAPAAATL